MHIEAALSETIDVFPRLRSVEGKHSWTNTNDWTILVMHLLFLQGQTTFEQTDNARNRRNAIELWSWELRTWMKIQAVHDSVNEPCNGEDGGADDGGHKETHDGQ